jgi:hypothetical protein
MKENRGLAGFGFWQESGRLDHRGIELAVGHEKPGKVLAVSDIFRQPGKQFRHCLGWP